MCGIAGVLSFAGDPVTPDLVTRMRDTIVHRGPDGGETWVSEDMRIGLGFRRLSIIDLSPRRDAADGERGRLDPGSSSTARSTTTPRSGPELEALGGHTWRTDHSDTEVIVHAFEQWGIDCLHRFRGMFAFALWDERAQELWLVRDRIGIKPLYFSVHHGRITFASEIKALLQDPRAGTRGRRGGVLPLPLVPDDAGAEDAVRAESGSSRRAPGCGSRRDGDDPRAALLGSPRRTSSH